VKSFEEVLEETKGKNRHLLLGNGFSQAWRYRVFNYKNLLDSADFGHRNDKIKEIFYKLDTFDFETVMQTMLSSIYVCQSYNNYPTLVEAIELDADCLKSSLVSAIADSHPSNPSEVLDEQYESARRFLSQFASIFTLNYDLLMYWARNKYNLEPEDFDTDDGFRRFGVWNGIDTDQNVFFLHGALHLYDDGGVIKKHRYTEDGDTIIDQVRMNLRGNRFPIFVSEPTHEKKLDKILHNPYLNFCYNKLGKMNDTLVIYGHSMDETDTHIFDQVDKSNVTDVYVSILVSKIQDKIEEQRQMLSLISIQRMCIFFKQKALQFGIEL